MTNNQRSNCQQSLDHRESKKVPEKKFYSLPGGSDGKETACNVGELSSIPGLGRYPSVQILGVSPCGKEPSFLLRDLKSIFVITKLSQHIIVICFILMEIEQQHVYN